MLNRAYALLEIKEANESDRTFSGIATTPATDLVDDVVEPKGAQFTLPIPFLWQHRSDEPIGHVTEARVTDKGIFVKGRLTKVEEPGRLKDRLDEAWQTMKSGLVRGLSIGFKGIETARIEGSFGTRYLSWRWLELSAVTIAANMEASLTSIKEIDASQLASHGKEQEASGSKTAKVKLVAAEKTENSAKPGATGHPAMNRKAQTIMAKTVAEQISAFEATRAAKSARMEALMDAAAEAGVTLDAEQTEEYDGLEAELKSIDAHLKRLRDLEKAKASTAKPVEVKNAVEGSAARDHAVAIIREPKLPAGIEFARYAMCVAASKGVLPTALSMAESRYADTPRVVTALKAAVAAGTTTDATWAGALVDYTHFAGDFIEYLRPQTIIGKFGTNGIPSLRRVPFNIQIAGQTTGGTGYWVGEGQPKPVTKFDFANVTLTWYKAAAIAVLTEELVRFSNPAAEALVRDALRDAIVERLDTDFIDPAKAAVANVSPASITNAASEIVSAGTDADAVRADVAAVMGAFITANISPMDGVWIMNPNAALNAMLMRNPLGQAEFPEITMMGGRFAGFPVITSKYVPDGVVVFVNASDVYLADDGAVTIDASREASLQMDTAPTNNSTTPTATSLVSMFQTNSIALRAERYINWKLRRAASVQYLRDVDWGTSTGSDA